MFRNALLRWSRCSVRLCSVNRPRWTSPAADGPLGPLKPLIHRSKPWSNRSLKCCLSAILVLSTSCNSVPDRGPNPTNQNWILWTRFSAGLCCWRLLYRSAQGCTRWSGSRQTECLGSAVFCDWSHWGRSSIPEMLQPRPLRFDSEAWSQCGVRLGGLPAWSPSPSGRRGNVRSRGGDVSLSREALCISAIQVARVNWVRFVLACFYYWDASIRLLGLWVMWAVSWRDRVGEGALWEMWFLELNGDAVVKDLVTTALLQLTLEHPECCSHTSERCRAPTSRSCQKNTRTFK